MSVSALRVNGEDRRAFDHPSKLPCRNDDTSHGQCRFVPAANEPVEADAQEIAQDQRLAEADLSSAGLHRRQLRLRPRRPDSLRQPSQLRLSQAKA
jgi:hypothetical protein